jgi:phospholipase C
MSISTNVLTITDNSGTITSMTYVANSANVTSGEDSAPPPTVQKNGGVFTITFVCDRKKSAPVATAFNNNCNNNSLNAYAASGGGGLPEELNFFFQLELQVTTASGSGSAILNIGQGSYALTNNWWLGGPIVSSSQPGLNIPVNNGASQLNLPLSGTNSSFVIAAGTVRPSYPISRIFVLMLENHSFDNMFALSGIPGIIAATTSDSNSYNGTTYYVGGGAPSSMPTDPGHEFPDVVEQLGGVGAIYPVNGPYPTINNSGFAANYATTDSEGSPPASDKIGDIMLCFDTAADLPVAYQLATNFVLCDQWFSSLPGPTWPNRFFLHGASSNGLDHSPSKGEMAKWESVSGFTYPHGSIFDALNNDSVTYRLYYDPNGPIAGSVAQVASLKNILLTEMHSVNDLAEDLTGDYPYQYTFIEPNYGNIVNGSYEGGSSQHPMDGVTGGEALIKTVYEAIRNSPLWNESLLIITYDEHGGFYDSVPPGAAPLPDDGSSNTPGAKDSLSEFGFTFNTYGVRVPAIIVSPWVQAGGVDHTIYDHSSALATIEQVFGVLPLTARDKAANSVLPLLQSSARTDCPTTLNDPAPPPAPAAADLAAGAEALDATALIPERDNLQGLLAIMLKTKYELSDRSEATKAALYAEFRAIKTRGRAAAYIEEVMTQVEAIRAARKATPSDTN